MTTVTQVTVMRVQINRKIRRRSRLDLMTLARFNARSHCQPRKTCTNFALVYDF